MFINFTSVIVYTFLSKLNMVKNKNPLRKRKRRAPNKKKLKTFTNEWKKKLAISNKGSFYNQSTLWKDSHTEKRRKIILPEKDIDFDEEEIDLDGNRNNYIIKDFSLLNNALPKRACCEKMPKCFVCHL